MTDQSSHSSSRGTEGPPWYESPVGTGIGTTGPSDSGGRWTSVVEEVVGGRGGVGGLEGGALHTYDYCGGANAPDKGPSVGDCGRFRTTSYSSGLPLPQGFRFFTSENNTDGLTVRCRPWREVQNRQGRGKAVWVGSRIFGRDCRLTSFTTLNSPY